MELLKEKIYYVDVKLLEIINSNFDKIDSASWYELYSYKLDNSFWRLDMFDKLQTQYFIRLETKDNWTEYNDIHLRQELLKKTRSISNEQCKWIDCSNLALNGTVFCEVHAYEMGIR